jgi:excisionase family DNA binding protein
MKLQEDDRLLTVQQAEALTGRKASTFRKYIHLRRIATVRIGRQVRIPLSAIQALVSQGFTPAVTR